MLLAERLASAPAIAPDLDKLQVNLSHQCYQYLFSTSEAGVKHPRPSPLTHECLPRLASYQRHLSSPSLEHTLLVGGTDFRKASKQAKSPCDIVVGTPGRVLDFLEKGFINPCFVRLLVRTHNWADIAMVVLLHRLLQQCGGYLFDESAMEGVCACLRNEARDSFLAFVFPF